MRHLRIVPLALLVATVAAAAAASVWSGWRGLLAMAHSPAGTPDLGSACASTALVGVGLIAAWLALAMTASAVELLARPPDRRGTSPSPRSRTLRPWLVRRLVAGLLGVAAFATVSPAEAATSPLPAPTAISVLAVAAGDRPAAGVSVPVDRPAPQVAWSPAAPVRHQTALRAASTTLVTGAQRGEARTVDDVTVRRGDSLWSIAARHLADTGRPHRMADVAREWPRWWAANGHTIGSDPDQLLPGQRLVPPPVT